MRFLGQAEALSFMAQYPVHSESIRAWVAEVQSRSWPSAEAVVRDFRTADVSKPPGVVFRFGQPSLAAETIMDFRRGITLLTRIRESGPHSPSEEER